MIWFTAAYAELSAKRNCLADLDEQLRLHEGLYTQERGYPDVRSAKQNDGNQQNALPRSVQKLYPQVAQANESRTGPADRF